MSVCIPYSRVKNKLGDHYLAPLHSRFRGLRIMGCVVFDLCQLARGSLDITLALKMKPWDVLVGMIIVEEAGGKYMQNKEGDDYSLLLSNPDLQQYLQKDPFMQKLLKTCYLLRVQSLTLAGPIGLSLASELKPIGPK